MEILEKIREDLTTVVNPDQIANIDIGLEGAEEVSGKQDEVSSSGSTTFRAIPVESVPNPPSLQMSPLQDSIPLSSLWIN